MLCQAHHDQAQTDCSLVRGIDLADLPHVGSNLIKDAWQQRAVLRLAHEHQLFGCDSAMN